MPEIDDAPPSELRNALDAERRRKRIGLFSILGVLAVGVIIAATAFIVTALNGTTPQAEAETPAVERISLKIAGSGESPPQDVIKEVAAEQGVDIEWVNFDDWTLPNSALVAGEVDANSFQHIAFLSAFNVANDADLTPVVSTAIVQWGIFSPTIDDLADLAPGDRVVIPDDPSNGGRALFILRDAGLITLADNVGVYPTIDDIVENQSGIELVELAALSIKTQFDDPTVTAVVVGISYFEPTQGVTRDSALFLDDPLADTSLPYVNVIATTQENLDNPAWGILQAIYTDQRVIDAFDEESFGNTVLVDAGVERLRTKLAELEDLARELNG